MRADVSEWNRLTTDLGTAGRDALPAARVATQKSSADIKRDGQAFAPVDTGNLRNSIGYETWESADAVNGEIGPTASYGQHVEDGTSRMAPHAYMGPAFDRHAGEYEDAIASIIDRFGQ